MTSDSRIYRRAAELVAKQKDTSNVVACWAIDVAQAGGTQEQAEHPGGTGYIRGCCEQRSQFNDLFCNTEPATSWRWGEMWSDTGDKEEIKWCRVLALCFASAMAATGDL